MNIFGKIGINLRGITWFADTFLEEKAEAQRLLVDHTNTCARVEVECRPEDSGVRVEERVSRQTSRRCKRTKSVLTITMFLVTIVRFM